MFPMRNAPPSFVVFSALWDVLFEQRHKLKSLEIFTLSDNHPSTDRPNKTQLQCEHLLAAASRPFFDFEHVLMQKRVISTPRQTNDNVVLLVLSKTPNASLCCSARMNRASERYVLVSMCLCICFLYMYIEIKQTWFTSTLRLSHRQIQTARERERQRERERERASLDDNEDGLRPLTCVFEAVCCRPCQACPSMSVTNEDDDDENENQWILWYQVCQT